MRRGFAFFFYFKGVCDLEGFGGNLFIRFRASILLRGFRVILVGYGKRGFGDMGVFFGEEVGVVFFY